MKLNELKEEYLLYLEVQGRSPVSVKTTEHAINSFIRFAEDCSIHEVHKVMINRFIRDQMSEKKEKDVIIKKKIKNNTINYRISSVRSMYEFAKKEELILKNPFKEVVFLKEEKMVMKTYTPEDVNNILKALGGRDFLSIRNKTIITLLVETGIRNTEVCDIKMSDIYDSSIIIHGKGSRQRPVTITKPLQLQLMRYLRARSNYMSTKPDRDCEYLFINRMVTGMTRYGLLDMIKNLGSDLGIDIRSTIHGFRRYYAQQMLYNGTDLYSVSRLLGHTMLATTERYIQGIEDKTILEKGMNSPLSQPNKK